MPLSASCACALGHAVQVEPALDVHVTLGEPLAQTALQRRERRRSGRPSRHGARAAPGARLARGFSRRLSDRTVRIVRLRRSPAQRLDRAGDGLPQRVLVVAEAARAAALMFSAHCVRGCSSSPRWPWRPAWRGPSRHGRRRGGSSSRRDSLVLAAVGLGGRRLLVRRGHGARLAVSSARLARRFLRRRRGRLSPAQPRSQPGAATAAAAARSRLRSRCGRAAGAGFASGSRSSAIGRTSSRRGGIGTVRHFSNGSSARGTSITKRPGLLDAPADAAGLGAGAEIDVGARCADDGGAGVLPDHQAAEFRLRHLAGDRQVGLDPEHRAIGMQVPVDRDRSAGRELHALRSDRLLMIGKPGDAEEHEGLVHPPQRAPAVRLRQHPLADAVHRHLFFGHLAALDQDAADRQVGVTVVGVIVDAQHGAVFQPHARRSLDVDEERFDRILEPADLQLAPVERAVLDLGTIEIGTVFLPTRR